MGDSKRYAKHRTTILGMTEPACASSGSGDSGALPAVIASGAEEITSVAAAKRQ